MKRTLASALVLGIVSTFSMTGCSDETSATKKETITTPGGTTTTTQKTEIDSKGNNPPTNSAGETAKPPK